MWYADTFIFSYMEDFGCYVYVKVNIGNIIEEIGINLENRMHNTRFEDMDRDREEVYQYTSKGEYYPNASSPHDLFFVPVKKEGWVNVYKYRSRCTHLSGIIYSSKEEAESDAEVHESGINTYITTIKIEWEE